MAGQSRRAVGGVLHDHFAVHAVLLALRPQRIVCGGMGAVDGVGSVQLHGRATREMAVHDGGRHRADVHDQGGVLYLCRHLDAVSRFDLSARDVQRRMAGRALQADLRLEHLSGVGGRRDRGGAVLRRAEDGRPVERDRHCRAGQPGRSAHRGGHAHRRFETVGRHCLWRIHCADVDRRADVSAFVPREIARLRGGRSAGNSWHVCLAAVSGVSG